MAGGRRGLPPDDLWAYRSRHRVANTVSAIGAEHVVLWRLEISEPVSEHRKSTLDRRIKP
jgi:hypothetical protein